MPRRDLLGLLGVLALAGLLRLGWPSLSEFKLDEAHIASLALGIARLTSFPLRGTQSSVGIHMPAYADYVYALPLAVWPHPLSAMLFTALLNVLGVGLCWWVARRLWGSRAALAAGLLYAVSPWAVFYSRKIWEPNLVPALAMAWMAAGVYGSLDRKPWALALHVVLAAIVAQLHFAGAVVLPVTIYLLVTFRRRVTPRALGVGLSVGLASALPFAVYLWQDRAIIARSLVDLFGRTAADTSLGPSTDVVSRLLGVVGAAEGPGVWYWWRLMVSGGNLHALLGSAAPQAPWLQGPLMRLAATLGLGVVAAGLAVLVRRGLPRAADDTDRIGMALALWGLAPLALFAVGVALVHQHYLAIVLPVAALIGGRALGSGMGATRVWLRAPSVALLATLVTVQAAAALQVLALFAVQSTAGGLGMPLGHQTRAVRAAVERGGAVVVLSPGDNATHDPWAAVFGIHLYDTPHWLVDGRHAALFPREGAALLATEGVETGLESYHLFGALDNVAYVAAREGEEGFVVARIRPGVRPDLTPAPAERRLANGVEIAGYRLEGIPAPGETITWRLGWEVAGLGYDAARTYHVFNHLVDADGRRWAQADGSTTPTHTWRVGDLVVQTWRLSIPLEAPPGPYTMRVGMYTYPQLEAQVVLDGAGRPIADGVLLGPLGNTP